ncbi:MAG: S8 family serine peptidase [bacterium]|nr:S8 family serine peptidase [bacterium]
MKTKIVILLLIICIPEILFSQFNNIQITTRLRENFLDKSGRPLTGKGVLIGDIDSGIDIFNPMFFFADGGEFKFIDVDKNDKFTSGKDAIDMNKNGKADKGEMLRYIEMQDEVYKLLPMDAGNYNPGMDFLYIDKNNNGKRDYGTKDGFTENDPTYGEQIFISIDKDENDALDKGEKLIALKTSKVRAVREKDGTVRRRGIDLIKTEPDSIFGHGTSVSGVLIGGTSGVQEVHGIAPDAELVLATIEYDYTPRFVKNFPDLVRFIKGEGVDIILFEDGEWGWEFMDGSSEEEQLVNEYARDGITIIGGSGNLASGKMHLKDTLKGGEQQTYIINAAREAEGKLNNGVFASLLWNNSEADLKVIIETPESNITAELDPQSNYTIAGGYNIYYAKEVSPKGTAMFKLSFSKTDSSDVGGEWKINVTSDNNVIVNGYVVDVTQSWAGNTHWTTNLTDETTVTFPSTADSIISVGAYAVNFGWDEKVGELATYSGRGVNIDGKTGVDITAPGHTSFSIGTGHRYVIFSGTSAAAPHVTGAAALMLQYDPTLTHSRIREILISTAKQDQFTGSVPNPEWGYGKLNIEAAIKYLMKNSL